MEQKQSLENESEYGGAKLEDQDQEDSRTRGEGADSEGTSMAGRGGLATAAKEAEVALFLLHYRRRRSWRCRKKRSIRDYCWEGTQRIEGAGGYISKGKERLAVLAEAQVDGFLLAAAATQLILARKVCSIWRRQPRRSDRKHRSNMCRNDSAGGVERSSVGLGNWQRHNCNWEAARYDDG
ncbi:hypothetical protein B296_00054169 [Ensete ventricosum]|uniref:Uncharacterized protein n=1 Tax=Ensete ventricosum TaxID=4639 RepID=A0A426XEV3_ENSVE|nr:hypothetical protein B296_00054169 [Ensete ventricosum]